MIANRGFHIFPVSTNALSGQSAEIALSSSAFLATAKAPLKRGLPLNL
jgi:hypothetical protein